ncbi:hypothetical protein IGI37_002968 [Enterococcus sp. AZ194]|uniref:hypothetical protein n=1 Tax=Enterococcus sp. AZ194 TaxID=2774629 RepID=UPI003F216929
MSRAFNELIKEFNMIRPYARDFYINGFKPREEFTEKSLRSYDNERRRIESYLASYAVWEQTAQGKIIRLDLKQNSEDMNPFFNLWQTKSFTKNDIFLHFVLLDCLAECAQSLTELTERIHDEYLSHFEKAPTLSEITVRNKLKEYCQLGLIKETEKDRRIYYQLTTPVLLTKKMIPALHFFKEVLPAGVLGQFLLNQTAPQTKSPFVFKHHFIVHSLDELVVLDSLTAIAQGKYLTISRTNNRPLKIAPVSLYISTETGRQYLIGYARKNRLSSFKIENIQGTSIGETIDNYEELKDRFARVKNTSWNGSFNDRPLQHLRVRLFIIEGKEDYLVSRIQREQRMGTHRRLDSTTVLFEIDLIDLFAINPFLRTFIGRIISIDSTDEMWQKTFIHDMKKLITHYSVQEGGEI